MSEYTISMKHKCRRVNGPSLMLHLPGGVRAEIVQPHQIPLADRLYPGFAVIEKSTEQELVI
jgi:hypothetical protein